MSPEVLQVGRLSASGEARIRAALRVTLLAEQADPDGFLRSEGPRFSGLITIAPIGASRGLLSQLPNLKVIACRGIGVEKVDLEAARQRGIAVSSTPDVLTDCVADLGIGLMIDTVRAISAADRYVRAGQWPNGAFPLATRFSGKKLGLLGLGKIGRAIARRAEGFQMQIRYHNRQPDPNCGYAYEPSAASLAGWCDFLMVAVSGGPHSHHLVNGAVLTALGPEGFLFNVSRGSVIDEQALVDALTEKTIAGAGLDVYAQEPHVPEQLKRLNNVVLAPHIGSGTHETRTAMEALVLENLQSFFSTGKLLTPVT
ncbi:MAG: 2-hydroxyacid dehydrogenase [Betaproteobacteria bacterium]|nr:2-hydroxyacid dehydrogenase [Betaproteobacteria bacterium]